MIDSTKRLLQTKKRILQACVRVFPGNGCCQTTMLQILREEQQVLAFLAEPDMRGAARSVMEELFRRSAMRYEFSLDGLLPSEKC